MNLWKWQWRELDFLSYMKEYTLLYDRKGAISSMYSKY